MVKLTEDMVTARAKTSDMECVTKLNFWGSDLTDIHLVRQFKRATILSFSLNSISTLADFQFCTSLQELYIRRNNIRDLREICYLKDLPNLKRLLMTENPCCETAGDLYRPTILRALPRLEVLDNQEVTPIEIEYALQLGLILEHPTERSDRQAHIIPGTKIYEGPNDNKTWPPPTNIHSNNSHQRGGYNNESLHENNEKKDSFIYHNYDQTHNNVSNRVGESGTEAPTFQSKIGNHNNNNPASNKYPQRPSTATAVLHNLPPVHSTLGQGHNSERIHSDYRQQQPVAQASQRKCASPLLEFYRNDFCRQRNSSQTMDSTRCISTTKWTHNANNNNINNSNCDWNNAISNNNMVEHQDTPTTIKKSNGNLVSAALCLISEMSSKDLDMVEDALKRKQEELHYAQQRSQTCNKSDTRSSSFRFNY